MKGEKAVEIFEIVRQKKLLPTKIEELVPLSFIGQTAVNFYRDKVKLMSQLEMTEEQRKATLKDGQNAGEMLLDIEARIGELIIKDKPTEVRRDNLGRLKPEKYIPEGLPKERSAHSQQIAKHPEVVEYVKAKAKEIEDIPTKTAVLSEIKFRKSLEAKPPLTKEPKPRPEIDEFVDDTIKKTNDLVTDLFKLVGNIKHIESELTKESLKSNLNVLYEMIGKIKKEF